MGVQKFRNLNLNEKRDGVVLMDTGGGASVISGGKIWQGEQLLWKLLCKFDYATLILSQLTRPKHTDIWSGGKFV